MVFLNAHTHFSVHEDLEILNAEAVSSKSRFYSIGIHPWHADLDLSRKFCDKQTSPKTPGLLAIGEIGLDKLKGPDLAIQLEVFQRLAYFAEEMELPLIIHCVKAWNELYKVYTEIQPKQKWVFHGFNKAGILHHVLKTDLMISLGESVLSNEKLRSQIPIIPISRILLETDDSSCDIQQIYSAVSDLKKIPLPEFCDQIEQNFKNTFTKWTTG